LELKLEAVKEGFRPVEPLAVRVVLTTRESIHDDRRRTSSGRLKMMVGRFRLSAGGPATAKRSEFGGEGQN